MRRLRIIRSAMMDCMNRGLQAEGLLPGGLGLQRRARNLAHRLESRNHILPHSAMEWVSLRAIAVNEENAAGGES